MHKLGPVVAEPHDGKAEANPKSGYTIPGDSNISCTIYSTRLPRILHNGSSPEAMYSLVEHP